MTLGEAVEQVSARLEAAGVAFGHGTTTSDDEAAWLVLWRLGLPLDALEAQVSRRLSTVEVSAIDALAARRIHERVPAAYLTGEAWLHGVPFFVDRRVIVPRSLIAEPLLDGTLDAWLTAPPRRVLDLCTGSGSLAVLAALHWPDAAVDASDLSADALEVAARNVARHGLDARVHLRQSDGLDAFDAGVERFDLILCNPPYVNAASMAMLPPEYRAEPALALAGGADGMDFVRHLLAAGTRGAASHLAADGALVLEIGHERAHFEAAFPRLEPVWLPTSAGDDQVLLITRSALVRARSEAGAGAGGVT